MKIAIVTATFPPYIGGMGNSAYEIARLLAMQNQVTVFTPFCHCERNEVERSNPCPPDRHVCNGNLKIEYIKPTLQIGKGAVLLKLWQELKEFDLLYLHYPFFGTTEIIWLFKLLNPKIKLIIHFHMDTPALSWKMKILSLPSLIIKKSLFKRADKVISASLDYVAHSSIKKYFLWKKTRFYDSHS